MSNKEQRIDGIIYSEETLLANTQVVSDLRRSPYCKLDGYRIYFKLSEKHKQELTVRNPIIENYLEKLRERREELRETPVKKLALYELESYLTELWNTDCKIAEMYTLYEELGHKKWVSS